MVESILGDGIIESEWVGRQVLHGKLDDGQWGYG